MQGQEPIARKRVVIHIGPYKTGSTTIQRMLAANADTLAPGVVAVPAQRLTGRWRRGAVSASRRGLSLDNPETRAAAHETAAAIAALDAPCVILSAENLSGRVPAARGRTIRDHIADTTGLIAEVFAEFDWRVVVYFRETENWLRSRHNEDVKQGKSRMRYERWRARLPADLDYRPTLDALAARHGPHVVPVAMEEEAREGRFLGEAVLRAAGLEGDALDRILPGPRQNESLSPEMLEIARRINYLPIGWKLRRGMMAVVRHRLER